jgi:hypothetical protein
MVIIKKTIALAAVAGFAIQLSGNAIAGEKSFEIYGFAQLDFIQDFGRVDPDWADTLRPSRIPVEDPLIFGDDGETLLSIKQTRFGVKGNLPAGGGDVFARFEFDLFGVGEDAGQTAIRIRHAYGEYGQILAGQTHSLFMDINMFPNTIDYWGPDGMVFLRNPQIRWTPIKGKSTFAIAVENPSTDIDPGQYRFDETFDGVQAKDDLPDLTARYRLTGDFGHVQLAGILRSLTAEGLCNPEQTDPAAINYCPGGPGGETQVIFDDTTMGWGLNLTSVTNLFERDAIRAGVVYGEGIASYMNDGGMDVGPKLAVDSAPPGGQSIEAVPLLGMSAYYDHYWNDRFSSSIGYSFNEVDNTAGQTPDTYKKGQYTSVNLLYYPAEKVMTGIELLWGDRENLDGKSNDDTRIQISFKYSFDSGNLLARD